MRTLLLAFFIALTGCHAVTPDRLTKDTVITPEPSGESEVQRMYEEDSGYRDTVINQLVHEALTYAAAHAKEGQFTHELFTPVKDGGTLQTSLSYGQLFDPGRTHLYIKSATGSAGFDVLGQVYLFEQNTFRLVASDTIWKGNFVGDSIGDVNGDKLKDYMLITYASSGCCLRNDYTVYRYNAVTGGFGEARHFINPDFFPAEKVIRGVEYGHPGEVPLYKLRWKDTIVEPVEYIYRDPENKSQFIRTKVATYPPDRKTGEILKKVPAEYLHIEGYEWFMLDP
ncbi:hypothetical protein [Chitinophaga pinensis]|uniref:Uncharacterized protein n=1 Tax=Chitinophaga pinensis TaxID=79329 RepID=A0A5C6LNG5_9BACT|nr:hypothetical protein [Chitinophaga pinensis]TWV98840.1 hypothetical protein FEF09_19945 [Chitinophaga pinensis]